MSQAGQRANQSALRAHFRDAQKELTAIKTERQAVTQAVAGYDRDITAMKLCIEDAFQQQSR